MANNWAIAIGINQYQFFQPLGCAQADAEALKDFLIVEAGFLQQQCLLMTDTSPPLGDRSTYPTKENILLLLEDLAAACWQPQDKVWFFFSGYGVNHNGQDYLMPAEANPEQIEETGIEVRAIMQSLLVAELDIVLMFDINRAFANKGNDLVGQEIIELAQELEIPTILSCQPEQFSHESSELGHGFFTAALLEALRSHHGNTLEGLERYLSLRTPELCQHYWRPTQNPVTVIPSREQDILPTSEVDEDREESPMIGSREILAAALPAPSLHPNPQINYSAWQSTTNPDTDTNMHQYGNKQTVPISSHSLKSSLSSTKIKKSKRAGNTWLSNPLLLWSAGTMLTLGLVTVVYLRNQGGLKVVEMLSASTKAVNDDTETEILPISPDTSYDTNFIKTSPVTLAPAPKSQLPSSISANSQAIKHNKARLELAKMSLRPNQASDLSLAIAKARKIQPDQPLYQQAQDNIQIWSRMILDLAESRAQRRQYAKAIAAAQLVGKDESIYPQAQASISLWRIEAKQYMSNKTLLDAANALIMPGQASTYNRAIEVAKKVAPGEPGFEQAQKSINQWSEKILDIAIKRASQRQFQAAIATVLLVPQESSAYKKAQQALQKWQQQ
ncbi:caspase family protein [Chlorogloeopsis sp. ULAP01]|uniref:caspase family protein n=1 Tax=Chlorogloeopsis sp. ULAP01 TaxID=3056483 RepID=UPI0025AA8F93|nr:caspase family protein [Chlorogloeopsis sp. ULAP01]MDM9384270.1 caspase family protein [Chlorogloeopsis sp. ULAP01]